MAPRPDGAPLRDGDTQPYPGWPRNVELIHEPRPVPQWAIEATRPLDPVVLVRPYLLFAPKIQRPKPWP